MPSLFKIHEYVVFFWSNENDEPIHVHVAKGTPNPNSTKLWLTKDGGKLIDCQTYTENMARYGAREITRKQYLAKLEKYAKVPLKCEIGKLFDL